MEIVDKVTSTLNTTTGKTVFGVSVGAIALICLGFILYKRYA